MWIALRNKISNIKFSRVKKTLTSCENFYIFYLLFRFVLRILRFNWMQSQMKVKCFCAIEANGLHEKNHRHKDLIIVGSTNALKILGVFQVIKEIVHLFLSKNKKNNLINVGKNNLAIVKRNLT